MEPTDLVAAAAAVLAVCSYAVIARSSPGGPGPWWIPAVPLVVFAAWTAHSIAQDGPFGFWREHVGAPWETQIWLDLLIMAGIAWWLAQPRLRRLGAPRTPWLLLIVATGSIGALSMVLWIRHREAALERQASAPVAEPVLPR